MNIRRVVAAIGILAILVTGFAVTISFLLAPKPSPSVATTRPPTIAPPAPKVPTPAEFMIGVVVTDTKCAAPNACTYKYNIEPKYIGLHPLPANEIKVIYQVTGGHQPQTGDFTIKGTQARVLQDVTLDGPPNARLTAAVTQIVG
jgi:hypothetical protein